MEFSIPFKTIYIYWVQQIVEKLPFLDSYIKRVDTNLKSNTYWENTPAYKRNISINPNHSRKNKLAAFNRMVFRFRNIPMESGENRNYKIYRTYQTMSMWSRWQFVNFSFHIFHHTYLPYKQSLFICTIL